VAAVQLYFKTPPKVTLSITDTCNLDCRYCYGDCNRATGEPELPIDEWRRFVDYLIERGVIELFIEGGEPLLKPGFDELLASCARRLMTMVRTHGTLIDAELARRWTDLGVGRVFVDVMGATAAVHDHVAGRRGSFDKTCRAVQHLVACGIPTDMLVILHRHTAPELQRILELAHSLGAGRVGVLRLYPLGRARRRWSELALSLDEQEAALAALRPPPGLGLMKSWHPQDGNCCWQSATVDARGNSIGCPYLREYVNYGNIRKVDFFDGWHGDPLYRKLRSGRVDKSCPDCRSSEGSSGGCRSTAYAFHGRWTAPDPFCRSLNDGVKIDVLPERLLRADADAAHPAGA
jgi:radical SAM protein with 4Fe4S-binding SPASM domain